MSDITINETRLAEIMRGAAEVLRNDGWARGDMYVPDEGYCAFGACWKVLGLDHADDGAYGVVWTDIEEESNLIGAIDQYFIQNRDKFVPDDEFGDIWSLADYNDRVINNAEQLITWFETEADKIEQAARG